MSQYLTLATSESIIRSMSSVLVCLLLSMVLYLLSFLLSDSFPGCHVLEGTQTAKTRARGNLNIAQLFLGLATLTAS